MRTIKPGRNVGDNREIDIQVMIDEQPVTVAVTRMTSGDNLTGIGTVTTVTTFQARIEPLPMGPRYLEDRDRHGFLTNVTHRIVARSGTDKNGNAVTIRHGDNAVISGTSYRVLYVNDLSFMTEAICEVRQ